MQAAAQFRSKSVVGLFLLALLTAIGCGTRAGNPKKPTGAAIQLPLITFAVPESTTLTPSGSLSLAGLDGLDTGLSSGPDRAVVMNTALNTFNGKLNETPIYLDAPFRRTYEGSLVGVVRELKGVEDYAYEAVFCTGTTLFYHLRWSADGLHVRAVRDFAVNPVSPAADLAYQALAVKLDVDYRTAEGKRQFESHAQGVATSADVFLPNQNYLTDFVHVEEAEGGVFNYRSIFDRSEVDIPPYQGDAWFSGSLKPDGTHTLAGQHNAIVLCSPVFDPENTADPHWCFGLEGTKDQKVPRLLKAEERDVFWASISSVGIGQDKDMRRVTFDAALTCPVP